ncbi:hypothetical protein [Gloeobacter kilaueensis]|uniref:DUF3618 domain-containing protein n=1 Tax=Gloeobacter kilaueensis (strain ATCC BAA-2537 / CCAP 1431/1 / ULC 316 / JS1) TaxID=1183438 RepID=U5QFQ1_GLOK1|nr:hypothetical protein [Gloeobacter kilaueensis]AGY56505.1 hypothetical protein GKIL_0258 [Gloeobacter kilaueensis JS1]
MADTQEISVVTNGKLAATPADELPLSEADLQRTRERIAQTATQIEKRVKEDLNWRTWVGRYPLTAVGLAAAAGALVAMGLPDRRNKNRTGEAAIVREASKNSLLATVVSTVATIALREGIKVVSERLLGESNREKN